MKKVILLILMTMPLWLMAQQTGSPPGVTQPQNTARIDGTGDNANLFMYFGNSKFFQVPTFKQFDTRNVSKYNRTYYPEGTPFIFTGDSFTQGVGATDTTRDYAHIVSKQLGIADFNYYNYALGGTGIFYANMVAVGYISPANLTHTKTLMVGLNDMPRYLNYKTLNKQKYGVMSFLSKVFASAQLPASDPSITKTGTWTNFANAQSVAAGSAGGNIGGSAMQTSTAGATATFTFTATNIYLSVIGSDGITNPVRNFNVSVDGLSYGDYNFNDVTDGQPDGIGIVQKYFAVPVVIRNLKSGVAHTVTITTLSTGGTNFILDHIGIMALPQDAGSVIIGETPKSTQQLYAIQISQGFKASDALYNSCDSAHDEAIKVFGGYPITKAPVNSYYNPYGNVVADGLHPNDNGHMQIANAFLSVIEKKRNTTPYVQNISNKLAPLGGRGMYLEYDPATGTSRIYSYDGSFPRYDNLNIQAHDVNLISDPTGNVLANGSVVITQAMVGQNLIYADGKLQGVIPTLAQVGAKGNDYPGVIFSDGYVSRGNIVANSYSSTGAKIQLGDFNFGLSSNNSTLYAWTGGDMQVRQTSSGNLANIFGATLYSNNRPLQTRLLYDYVPGIPGTVNSTDSVTSAISKLQQQLSLTGPALDPAGNEVLTNRITSKCSGVVGGNVFEKSPNGSWYWIHTDDDGSRLADPVTVSAGSQGEITVTLTAAPNTILSCTLP